jgi:polyisoprenoid-binding protein YceI
MLCLLALGSVQAADNYSIDAAHSLIGFSVRHLVISKTKGTFGDVTGSLVYVEKDIAKSSVEVTIKVASIDTDNEKRDNHLKSPDFFDVDKYPVITFKSTQVKKVKDGFVAIGDFTIHGVTKQIKLPFMITGIVADPMGNTKLGVEAEISIDRRDYGLTWSKALETGGLVVGNDVSIELSVEFAKQ